MFVLHPTPGYVLAELADPAAAIPDAGTFLGLAMDAQGQGADRLAVPVAALPPAFFDLRSGLMGDVFQKAINYRVKLAIVGDVDGYLARSEALQALVRECLRGADFRFAPTVAALLEMPW